MATNQSDGIAPASAPASGDAPADDRTAASAAPPGAIVRSWHTRRRVALEMVAGTLTASRQTDSVQPRHTATEVAARQRARVRLSDVVEAESITLAHNDHEKTSVVVDETIRLPAYPVAGPNAMYGPLVPDSYITPKGSNSTDIVLTLTAGLLMLGVGAPCTSAAAAREPDL